MIDSKSRNPPALHSPSQEQNTSQYRGDAIAVKTLANSGLPTYHRGMARGWESKSVEEQMSVHDEHPASQSAKDKVIGELAKKRDVQALELQRERILSERTSSPHRRAALQAALSDIEARLTSFN